MITWSDWYAEVVKWAGALEITDRKMNRELESFESNVFKSGKATCIPQERVKAYIMLFNQQSFGVLYLQERIYFKMFS